MKPASTSAAYLYTGYILALAGHREQAEATIAEWRRTSRPSPVLHSMLPQCYAALGEKARALDSLEQAFSQHSSDLVWAKARPEFDSLRGEPRFAALLQKMGLTP